jgi:hypothetical protein
MMFKKIFISSVMASFFVMMSTVIAAPNATTITQPKTAQSAQKSKIIGTPLTQDMAEKYFTNCLESSRAQGIMSETTAQNYCGCTAVEMKDNLSQEEVAGLNEKMEVSRPVLNKVLIEVNGPCIHYPVKDLVHSKCMTDVGNSPVCQCVSEKISQFIKNISGRMLPEILKEDPNIFDPMGPIMESNEYKMRERQIVMSCATNPTQK